MKEPWIIGHRGAPRICPENTLTSFERAIDLGVDGIELDVQLSADDELVVIHDELIDRTTEDETGLVRNFCLAQLKRMDFGGWFDRSFAGERIPTLEEVLELIKSKTGGNMDRLHLDVELKTGIVPYDGIEQQVVDLLKAYDYSNVQCSSFYHQSLVTVRDIDPDIQTGVLYASGLYEPWKYGQRLGAQFINPNYQALSMPPEVLNQGHPGPSQDRENCQALDLKYVPWTVDSEKAMTSMFGDGVDGIITNRPDVAIALRDEATRGPEDSRDDR